MPTNQASPGLKRLFNVDRYSIERFEQILSNPEKMQTYQDKHIMRALNAMTQKIDPENPHYYYLKAMVLLHTPLGKGREEEGVAILEKALALNHELECDPNVPEATPESLLKPAPAA